MGAALTLERPWVGDHHGGILGIVHLAWSSPFAFCRRLVRGESWQAELGAGARLTQLAQEVFRYGDGGRSLLIELEQTRSGRRIVHCRGIKGWEPPHAQEAPTDEDRGIIGQRIQQFFVAAGIRCDLD